MLLLLPLVASMLLLLPLVVSMLLLLPLVTSMLLLLPLVASMARQCHLYKPPRTYLHKRPKTYPPDLPAGSLQEGEELPAVHLLQAGLWLLWLQSAEVLGSVC